jgi:hypothetical protein
MPSFTWRSSIGTRILAGTYQEEDQTYNMGSEPEAGPPRERRRSSVIAVSVSWAQVLTPAQKDQLDDFYRNELKCVEPFNRVDPKSGVVRVYKFAESPKSRELALNHWHVTFNFLRLS